MNDQEPKSRPFRFIDPRQERIHRRLILVGPGPAAFYRDVCRLMNQDSSLDTAPHLVAHSLREIESALRKVLLPHDFTPAEACSKCGNRPEAHRKQINAIVQTYGLENSVTAAWYMLVGREEGGLARLAHRNALLSPRQVNEILKKTCDGAEALFDAVLAKFEDEFLRSFELLDRLLAKTSPTADDVRRLKNKVPNNLVTLGYFFNKLNNPAWIEPLRRDSFFRHPPELIPNEENGALEVQPWPESRYLARMAALQSCQEKVLEIALEIPDTPNFYVHEDLVDIALALPPNLAAGLVPKVKRWLLVSRHPLLPEKLGSLISSHAKGGQIDAALNLARSLLGVVPGQSLRKETTQSEEEEGRAAGQGLPNRQDGPETSKEKTLLERMSDLPTEPQPRFDLWHYERIVKKNVPDLVAVAGTEAFTLLCGLLETGLSLSRGEKSKAPEDYSYIWRPQVEDVGERHLHRVNDVLVSAVRDAAEQIAKANPEKVPELLNELDRRPWRIFHRIALHLLRVGADEAPDLVAAFLTNRQIFDELGRRHECRLLAQARFGLLRPGDQEKILRWIQEKPDIERFKEYRKNLTGGLPNDEEIEKYVIHCHLEYLKPLRDALPPKWKQHYEDWVAKVGEPEDFDAYPRSWVGPTSPKSEQELRSMPVAEIIDYLKSWQPSEEIMTPSPEGLGRTLAVVIASDPDRFASVPQRFQEVDPTYVRGFFRGLHDAVRAQRAFPWRPVLDLCRWVIGQPREIPGRKSEYEDLDPGWGWTSKTIGELLSVGLDHGVTEIPYELRPLVWETLEPLTQDPEPTPEYEATYGGSNMDPSHISINTTRGEAMHAIFSYALWARRHLEKMPDGKERLTKGFEEMPEVRKVLDEHLDVSRDPSLAIRSVYGRWLPWLILLDKDWTKSRLGKIFPKDDSQRAYWDAAWETCIVFCRPHGPLFDLMKDSYALAIERLGAPRGDRRVLADPDERLAEHIIAFYWGRKIDLNDLLFERFWERASGEVRAHAIESIGRSLKDTEEKIEPEIIQRLRQLWERRLSKAKTVPRPDGYQAEIAAFGWWFVSEKFDDCWVVEQLLDALMIAGKIDPDHWVIERLVTLVTTMPLQVVDCLRLIIESDTKRWITYGSKKEIRTLISAALSTGDAEAAKRARELVNVLAARGHLEFMDLNSNG